MAVSLNALTKEELSNMVIEYQNKFDKMLPSINSAFSNNESE